MFEELSVGMIAIAGGLTVLVVLGYAAKHIGMPPVLPMIIGLLIVGFGIWMLYRQAT